MPTLKLKRPLKFGESTISELKFRDHTIAADYLAFDVRGGYAQIQALIANMTGTDVALVEKLHGVDFMRARKVADDLLEADEREFNSGVDGAEKKLQES